MTVVDASVLVDVLLGLEPSTAAMKRLLVVEGETLVAPHLVDAEVLAVLRRHALGGQLTWARVQVALDDFAALPLHRYPHGPLLGRCLELARNVTAYDGLYLALAEALEAPLLTRDGHLARAPGHRARVELVG